jgi:hypothetical protein
VIKKRLKTAENYTLTSTSDNLPHNNASYVIQLQVLAQKTTIHYLC